MKKHIYTVTIMAVLAGIYHFGCTSAAKEHDTTTTMQSTKFDGAQGDCTNGGIKIEVLLNGVVDGTQTQYICNGTQGENGQSGTSTSIKTTKFDGAQGDCTNGDTTAKPETKPETEPETKPETSTSGKTMYVTANSLNVRKGPGTNYSVVGSLKSGKEVSVISTSGGWAKINFNSGVAYVSEQYLSKSNPYDFSNVSVGDIRVFGHYEQDNNTTNGKEPIEWRVLDINAAGQYLVISDKVLERKKYNETYIGITWEKSTIRSWLNGYSSSYNSDGVNYTSNNFIDAAFTAEEQAKIIASNVPAHQNLSWGTSPGNATTDKIFLLSIVEAKQYFANDTARLADATRYVVKQGLEVRGTDTVNISVGTNKHDGTCTNVYCFAYWWLRSPGDISSRAAYVGNSGAVSTIGNVVDYVYFGVRPALWLNH
jgi:uncharacterized protein YgiM (DUF1202 family)